MSEIKSALQSNIVHILENKPSKNIEGFKQLQLESKRKLIEEFKQLYIYDEKGNLRRYCKQRILLMVADTKDNYLMIKEVGVEYNIILTMTS
ncbi:unnamed protein product (macronuclear) [Paramecium tetraurelia]|uniref:Uncharacterized protein n=1 Tax=Paramecium tetraurelia TaxID=5888 RepID=A0CEJ5_PARTE|nr:uncharacterized protein GSPATT00037650001 [Paramecium tetraurelia]CAK69212.1 unnamed protein product [Paramecium tetraurelia]|eukprot:XP_001436609.1 hypothetical protein (macronuclear) [Paramecium tetraurelia strain d4-2]